MCQDLAGVYDESEGLHLQGLVDRGHLVLQTNGKVLGRGPEEHILYELNGLNRGLKSGLCDGMTWGEDVLSACYGVVSGYWDFTLCHEHYR